MNKSAAGLVRFLEARFSPKGYLGLHLTIGLLVTALTWWCFSEVAEHLAPPDWAVRMDGKIVGAFHRHGTPLLTHLARAISFCASVGCLSVLSFLGAVFLLLKNFYLRALALALTMLGGSGLNLLLKHFFHRQRPVLENPLVTLNSFGFPSGHTMGATLFYGLLALFVWRATRQYSRRVLAIMAAGLMILLVALSRVYLGAHFPTDVVGAFFAGAGWLALCWTGVEILRRREHRGHLPN